MNTKLAETKLERLFPGDSEMARQMRTFDWSQTVLGPVEHWPQSLRTILSILLTSRHPIFVWWGPELIQFYNDAYRPILGATKHPAALGQDGRTCWREIWDVIAPLIEAVMERGEATFQEDALLVLDRNGYLEECYFVYAYSPIRDEAGRVGGIFVACNETTSKVLSTRRLRTLRDLAPEAGQAQSVQEACQVALQVLAQNPSDIPFAALYLRDAATAQARLVATLPLPVTAVGFPSVLGLTGGDDDDGAPLARAVREGAVVLITDVVSHFGDLPGGPWPEASHSLLTLPIQGPNHAEPSGILVVGLSPRLPYDNDYRSFLDLVTSHIGAAMANAQAYEAERKRAEALLELDRAKTTFFSNVSHEFRTPLTLLLGPTEAALANATDTQQREHLQVVHRNALRLQKLVNTLLDFSRLEAGRVQATYEPTDLAAFTTELASVFRSAVEKAGMRLLIDCPALAEPIYVDRDMVEKVVLNLISNAFKFTFAGEIEVKLGATDGVAELSVRDTGTGIPPEQLPHIFERFHRVENARARTHEGTGIGLALVQELVKLHGGTVSVQSVWGQGSRFTVTLPTGKDHLPPNRIGMAPTLPSTGLRASHFLEEVNGWLPDPNFGGENAEAEQTNRDNPLDHGQSKVRNPKSKIVWADDNADLREYVRRLLADRYEVVAVSNGLAALTAIRQGLPDLVLSDVMMPELDGFGLLRELRADPQTRTIPVILLSARAGEEARGAGLEVGVDDYLVKPFSAHELLARVGTHLEMARLRREAGETLRQSEARIRLALDVARLGTWSWDPEDDTVTADARCREICGLDPDATLTLPDMAAHFHPDDWLSVETALTAGIQPEGSGHYAVEVRFVRPDGGVRWIASHGQTLFAGESAARRPTLMLGTLLDIHERKVAEDELRQAHDKLEWRVRERTAELSTANEALREEIARRQRAEDERRKLEAQVQQAQKMESLGVLAGGIAHDFNNLLTSILGYADLARGELPSGSSTHYLLDKVMNGARRAAELTKQMLAYSGKGRFVVQPHNLSAVVEDISRLLQVSISKKCVLQYNFMLDLPAIEADAVQLGQIIMNLVINASEAIGDHSGVIAVSTGVMSCDHAYLSETYLDDNLPGGLYVYLEVADTGCGMTEETRASIFDPFFTTKFTGRGLGLAAVLGIVRGHRGAIKVYSEPGQGTTFKVLFPASGLPAGMTSGSSATSATWQGSGVVLIVDDEESVRELARRMLEALGFTVLTAVDGREGVEVFRTEAERIRLVLLDMTMPHLNGEETFREMRRIRSTVRTILSSGYNEQTATSRFVGKGLAGFIQKPYTFDNLKEVVRKVLEG